MKKQLRIFLSGIMVVVPLAITAYVIWSVGAWVDDLGTRILRVFGSKSEVPIGVGAALLLGAIYLIGLMTHFWIFRALFGWMERLLVRLPGVRTIYESVRDLMKLFGGDTRKMGRAVLCRIPGTDITALGILTNDRPRAVEGAGEPRVAVFLPFSYMLGGPTVLVPPKHVQEINLSVDQVLKLCTTAHVGGESQAKPKEPGASASPRAESH